MPQLSRAATALEYRRMSGHSQDNLRDRRMLLWKRILPAALLSMLLLAPCFWHTHIQAGDLGSHVYNAWLAQLAERGEVPGLYTVWQYQNVLFDLMLSVIGKAFGFAAGEKIAVGLCVLLFFWSVFALIRSATGNSPWRFVPAVAMLAYGYVFHMGFFNYYLSIALACLGLALVWNFRARNVLLALVLVPLMVLAHPMGLLFFLSISAYLFLWRKVPQLRWPLPLASICAAGGVHWFFLRHQGYEVGWPDRPFYFYSGADQLAVFGERYQWFVLAAVVLGVLMIAVSMRRMIRERELRSERVFLLHLFVMAFVAIVLLPDNLIINPAHGWIGLVVSRLTVITAILGLCFLASLPAHWWVAPAFTACALVFFGFLYQDTGFVDRMENNAASLVHGLPPGTRVLKTVYAPDNWRVRFIYHSIDRACIGHCFAYSNYEAATSQFRVRARAGNRFAVTDAETSEVMESGDYEVQEEDLPMKEIYQCDAADLAKLRMRDLVAGEENGRIGYRPER